MSKLKSVNVPWMGAVLDSFLAIFAPLVPIFHNFDITACLNGIPGLADSFRAFLARLVQSANNKAEGQIFQAALDSTM